MRKNEAKWYDSAKRWQIKIQKDGERRTFFSSTKGTKGKIAAEKAADAWLESGLASESTKCGELLDAYFGHISKSTSKSNANQQENFVKNYLKPAIAAKKIKKLTLLDLQAIIDNAYAQKNLSQKTLKNLRGCISGFIKYCRLGNYTNLNTADLTIPRSAKRPSKEILAQNSIQTLFTKDVTQFRGALQADWCINQTARLYVKDSNVFASSTESVPVCTAVFLVLRRTYSVLSISCGNKPARFKIRIRFAWVLSTAGSAMCSKTRISCTKRSANIPSL